MVWECTFIRMSSILILTLSFLPDKSILATRVATLPGVFSAAIPRPSPIVAPVTPPLRLLKSDRSASAPSPGAFQCHDCGKIYGLKRNLLRHCKFECGKEPQFQCPFCPQRFKQKCHVFRHATRLHPDCPKMY